MRAVLYIVLAIAITIGLIGKLTSMQAHDTVLLGEGGYDIVPINAPKLSGLTLWILSKIGKNGYIGPSILRALLNFNRVNVLRTVASQSKEPAIFFPIKVLDRTEQEKHEMLSKQTKESLLQFEKEIVSKCSSWTPPNGRWSTEDYAYAYRCGVTTPSKVATRILEAIHLKTGKYAHLKIFTQILEDQVLKAARESDERFSSGKPLGIFDGIPVSVKDDTDIEHYYTSYGTNYSAFKRATKDDTIVSRLKASGCVIVGKTSLTEYGTSPIGYNAKLNGTFNPWNDLYLTGGSSSGSAASVALNIVPFAIGYDGGGSIRVPSSVCGVFGLCSNFGRVPFDSPSILRSTTIRSGPIAGTARDTALGYMLLSEPLKDHFYSKLTESPYPHLTGVSGSNLNAEGYPPSGLRIGIFWDHFLHSDPVVHNSCLQAIKILKDKGAQLVNITIPHLSLLSLAHGISISSEFATMHDAKWYSDHDYEPQTLITLGIGRSVTSVEFLSAASMRGWGTKYFNNLFNTVDVIVTPTVASTELFRYSSSMDGYGESDTVKAMTAMKYIFLSNLLGIPSISIPVGNDPDNQIPIGLQVISNHWQENVLLKIATILDKEIPMKLPPNAFSPLSK